MHANSPQAIANVMSLEPSERCVPIRCRTFALGEDSGAPRCHRRGCGNTCAIGALARDLTLGAVSEATERDAYGIVLARRSLVGGRPCSAIEIAATGALRAARRGEMVRPAQERETTR